MMRYYMSSNVGPIGPMEAHEVRARIQGPHGADPTIQLCLEGAQNWGPVAHFPEFGDLFRGIAPGPRVKRPTNYWAWILALTLLVATALGIPGLIAGGVLLGYSVFAKATGSRSPFALFTRGTISWKSTIGGVLGGLLVMFISVVAIVTKEKGAEAAAHKAEAEAEAEAEAKAVDEARREANVPKLSETLAGWRKELEGASEIEPLESLQRESQAFAKESLPVGFESSELTAFYSDLSVKLAPLVKKLDALKLACGKSPVIDGWDRGNHMLEAALKRVAHDPGSIDVENCTQPVLLPEKCWQLSCDVLGKNAFGAQVRNRKLYFYSEARGFNE